MMKTDVVIIGGGPGGAASASFLAKKGIKSIIIEKEEFPRFHIGESMTGECGNVVRQLGLEKEMLKAAHPVKHGVRVYGKEGKNSFWVPVMKRNEQGELEKAFTWQVPRAHFDKTLLEHAKRQDEVMFVQGQAVKALTDESGELCGVQARRHDGETVDIYGQLVIDASGAATFLSNVGIAGKKDRGKYDRQLAIYSHVKGAIRDEEDNTLIFYEDRNHWGWFIPIDQERVSIGVVTPSSYYKESGESMRDFFLREMHKINPELSRRVPDVTLVEEVRATSNYSYQIHEFTGKRFVCIGDAHRFVDPIFSFGLHFAVTEARLVADHIADYLLRGKNRDKENPFVEFARYAELGMDSIEDLVDCFWENPISFAFFVHTRYRNDFIDLFAGRVYQDPPSPGLQAIRKVNAKGRAKQSQMADATPAPVA